MDSLAPHEIKFLELMKQDFLTDSPQIFDVGANAGQFAVACKMLWPACGLTCFEPAEGSFMELAKNTRPWPDISLNKCALGQTKDVVPLYQGPGPDQTASLHKRWLPGIGYLHPGSSMVDVRSLREAMDGPIDLLKLDVEGHEWDVLVGAGPELHREQIKRIYFEMNSCAIDARVFLRDFWRLLVEEKGYALWQVMSNGDLDPIEEYHEGLEDFAAHREFFAE